MNHETKLATFNKFEYTARSGAAIAFKKYAKFTMEFEDLYNQACLRLWFALAKYKEEFNCPQGAFYYKVIMRDLRRYCYKNIRQGIRSEKDEIVIQETCIYDEFGKYLIDCNLDEDKIIEKSVSNKEKIAGLINNIPTGEIFSMKFVQEKTNVEYSLVSKFLKRLAMDNVITKNERYGRSANIPITFTKI